MEILAEAIKMGFGDKEILKGFDFAVKTKNLSVLLVLMVVAKVLF